MATIEIDTREGGRANLQQRLEDALDQLRAGETLRLLTDTEPDRVHELLRTNRADQFNWRAVSAGPPAWESEITSVAHVVDARPTLAAGGEPFAEIMQAAGEVAPGEVLVVLAPFDPVPLQGVLGGQGFSYDSQPLDNGDYRVVFRLG